ncbi:MAG TPA: branched-chain amino acid ABC transporter permease [Chloroflexota bacterium]|nr:branched-chain amino acid ABC transporter permease [Chloroflexota bacterium]HEX2987405.1 branched-chain amino acid ABC transporter permease [Chloroflexota bacterium]
MDILLQILISGLAMGSIYGLVALGFVLLVNAADIINFAQGEFVMLGAFLVFTFADLWGLPFLLSVLLVVVVMAIFGLVMERIAYRPLQNTNAVTIIISTLGISVFLQNVALRTWGSVPEYFGLPFGRAMIDLGSIRLVPQHLLILGVAACLVLAQHWFFHNTRLGKLMRATAQDKQTARLMGVNIGLMTALTFAFASALGGLAGILLAPTFYISVSMGVRVGIKAFVASIIGGWGSIPGAMAGGLLIGLVEVLAAAYISSLYKDVFAFLLLILFLVVMPRGIFGEKVAQKV